MPGEKKNEAFIELRAKGEKDTINFSQGVFMNYSINHTTVSISINGGDPSPIKNFNFVGRDLEDKTVIELQCSETCNIQEFDNYGEPNGGITGK